MHACIPAFSPWNPPDRVALPFPDDRELARA